MYRGDSGFFQEDMKRYHLKLILSTIFSIISVSEVHLSHPNPDIISKNFHLLQTGNSSSVPSLKPPETQTKTHCANLCACFPSCKAFSYQVSARQCHLYDVTDVWTSTINTNLQFYSVTQDHLVPLKTPQEENARLMIFPHSFSSKSLQMYTKKKTLIPYPTIKVNYVKAATYDSKLNRLFIYVGLPRALFFHIMDTKALIKITQGKTTRCRSLAVDQERQLLFLGDEKLYSMKSDGSNLTEIKLNKGSIIFWALSVNDEKEIIYAAATGGIISFSYFGRNLKIISSIKGNDVRALTRDEKSNVLYYSYRTTLVRYSLSTGSSVKLTSLYDKESVLIYYDKNVYVTYRRKPLIEVLKVDVSSSKKNSVTKSYRLDSLSIPCLVT